MMGFRDEDRIGLAKDQVSCDLEGEAAILSLKDGVYYALDPVGTRVWALLKERTRTFGELRQTILSEYEVEREECDQDLRMFLNDLRTRQLVEVLA